MRHLLTAFAILVGLASAAVNSPGLIGGWPTERDHTGADSLKTTDVSVNDNTMFWQGTTITAWVAGKFGQCYDFNPLHSQYGRVTDEAAPGCNAEVTVCAWVRIDDTTARRCIVEYDDGVNLVGYGMVYYGGVPDSKRLQTYWGSTATFVTVGTTPIYQGVWTHVATVRRGTTGAWVDTQYVNGVFDGAGATATDPDGGNQYFLTADIAAGGWGFYGRIDEVYVWDKALSQNDIKRVMMGMHPLGM